MPVGDNITRGFLPPELRPAASTLKTNVIEANFDSSDEAEKHGSDRVLE